MINDLLGRLQGRLSVTATLELLEAIAGRKVSRLAFSENLVPWLDDLLSEAGAHWEPAHAPFCHDPDAGKGTWSSRSEQKRPSGARTLRSWQIFIAATSEQARAARDMEAANDEYALGISLGIPVCCIRFYLAHRDAARGAQNDYTLHSARASASTTRLPCWTNTLTQYFGHCLLSFAPCSYRCEAAVEYARRRYEFARGFNRSMADALLARQVCAGIYTEYDGVHLFQLEGITEQGVRFMPETIESTQPDGAWVYDLRRSREVSVDPTSGAVMLLTDTGVLRTGPPSTTALLAFTEVAGAPGF
jgi:hypothetical protein